MQKARRLLTAGERHFDKSGFVALDGCHGGEAVAVALPGTEVSINRDAPVDSRPYQVDFGLFERLAPDHLPRKTLADSIQGLVDGLRGMGFADGGFRDGGMIRLKTLERHLAAGRLTPDLRWAVPA